MMMTSVRGIPRMVITGVINGVVMSVPSPPRVVARGMPIVGRSPPPRRVPTVIVVPPEIIPTVGAVKGIPWVGVDVDIICVVRTAYDGNARCVKAHNAVGE
jgi:hypothetical protein